MATTKNPGTGKADAARRRRLFASAYAANGQNATRAAIAAGFSPRSAAQQGNRLLKDAKVSQAIKRLLDKVVNKYELNTDMVIRTIVQELTFDPAKLYDEAGNLLAITELDEDTRMALIGVEFEQRGDEEGRVTVRKVKWSPRNQAREQAMKHLGMFERDNEQARAQMPTVVNVIGVRGKK